MSADPGNPNSELEALKAQVQALHDSERRLMDTVKVAAGLMLGLAAILVLFSWFASHKNYEHDKQAIQKALETANEQRYAAFNRDLDNTLNARLTAREQALDRKLAELAQSLRAQVAAASAGGVSSNTLAQLGEETNQKIRLMTELIENRNAQPFGLLYFDYAIRSVNAKSFPAATEHFLSAALAFLRARDEANLNTCVSRLNQFCLPNLKADDFTARPVIEDKFALLVEGLEKANINGRHAVALTDLRREFLAARRRGTAPK
jgi:hypothetical protein